MEKNIVANQILPPEKGRLTPNELRKISGFEAFSDEEAERFLNYFFPFVKGLLRTVQQQLIIKTNGNIKINK